MIDGIEEQVTILIQKTVWVTYDQKENFGKVVQLGNFRGNYSNIKSDTETESETGPGEPVHLITVPNKPSQARKILLGRPRPRIQTVPKVGLSLLFCRAPAQFPPQSSGSSPRGFVVANGLANSWC